MSKPGRLPYDHADIVTAAKKELRRRYADRPDPERLLGSRFTIRELHEVHEAIAGIQNSRHGELVHAGSEVVFDGVCEGQVGAWVSGCGVGEFDA